MTAQSSTTGALPDAKARGPYAGTRDRGFFGLGMNYLALQNDRRSGFLPLTIAFARLFSEKLTIPW
jgi:hypothetical protein